MFSSRNKKNNHFNCPQYTFLSRELLNGDGNSELLIADRIKCIDEEVYTSRPGCLKLTMPLVNIWLKFQTLMSEIRQYFLLEKCEKLCSAKASLIFSTKNISVFGY